MMATVSLPATELKRGRLERQPRPRLHLLPSEVWKPEEFRLYPGECGFDLRATDYLCKPAVQGLVCLLRETPLSLALRDASQPEQLLHLLFSGMLRRTPRRAQYWSLRT